MPEPRPISSSWLSLTAGGDSRRVWLAAIGLLLMTVVVYEPAFHAGFIWDDDSYVTRNRLLSDPIGWLRAWIPGTTPQYYPVVFTMFWIEHVIWGLNPLGYHAVNVLLHAANAVLVWRLASWLRIPGAWLIGAVFAVHPVHVESVAWITERKNVLSGFFYLLAALAYLRFDSLRFPSPKQQSETSHRTWQWYGVSLGCFALALLAKTVTMSVITPRLARY